MYIYEIINTLDGKKYIGQTVQIVENRWWRHRRLLNNNSHYNPDLQHAWNLYGETAFTFKIITSCNSLEELNSLEEQLISSTPKEVLYNIESGGRNSIPSKITKLKISRKVKDWYSNPANIPKIKEAHRKRVLTVNTVTYYFKDEHGTIYSTNNLTQFCKEHGLKQPAMWRVWNKIWSHYKGWTLPENDDPRPVYELTSPSGELFVTKNLWVFANSHGLGNVGHVGLHQALKRKNNTYKQWVIRRLK